MNDDRTGAALVILLLGLGLVLLVAYRSGLRTFAQAIAFAEGYGVPGAIPTVRNNPGDLKLPSSGGAITTFATIAEGWAALYRQLAIIVSRQSQIYNPLMTIADMASRWTATEQTAWTSNVVSYLRSHGYPAVTAGTPIGEILT